jgi:hypothetical protein
LFCIFATQVKKLLLNICLILLSLSFTADIASGFFRSDADTVVLYEEESEKENKSGKEFKEDGTEKILYGYYSLPAVSTTKSPAAIEMTATLLSPHLEMPEQPPCLS